MSERKVILVVDDSASMRAAARSALEEKYQVVTAEDGFDAISMIATVKPDLMLVDIVMPKLDGYQTVCLIRLNDYFADTPIIMMSSKGSALDVARGRLIGFNGSIQKPFSPDGLTRIVEANLVGAAAAETAS